MKTGPKLFDTMARLQKRRTVAAVARRLEICRMGGAASKQARRRRQKARMRQLLAEHSARWAPLQEHMRPPATEALAGRMLLFMVAGQWYGRSDLVRAVGAGRPARGKVNQVLLKQGYVERVANPAYRGPVPPQRAREAAEPLWLYRLSESGIAEKARLEAARAAGDASPRVTPEANAARCHAMRKLGRRARDVRAGPSGSQ